MDCTATRLPYKQTGYYSKIITDYLDQSPSIKPFYKHPVSLDGITSAIRSRKEFLTNRQVLVEVLKKQYSSIKMTAKVTENIELLLKDQCFTITTAHQPAIFTGTLYFIYKILHTIKLSEYLSQALPGNHFVPVFYMGSEDADLEELGKIYLDEQEILWDTRQTGAVGRMKTKGLEMILNRIEGEYSVQPHGSELIKLLKDCYLNSEDIQTATFKLIDALFAEYGVVVLIPDNRDLKKLMVPIFEDELFHEKSATILDEPLKQLEREYKVQAHPREINLFYLKDDLRGRIERSGDQFIIHDSKIVFSESAMREELKLYPERFSPNVILRGLFQETILPNLAFIGGGGELAYWLELKALFEYYHVPYPVLILRNSFLIVESRWKEKLSRAGIGLEEIFKPAEELVNELVRKESSNQLSLANEINGAEEYYKHLKTLSGSIDPTLTQHVEALQSKALKPLRELEKKFLKAEKRKFEEQERQIAQIRSSLFPLNNLQERIENFIPYYARLGKSFIDLIYRNSSSLEQEFCILEEC